MPTDNEKRDHWIGFDLGGTKMLCCVYNNKFEQVGRARKKTKGRDGMKAGLARINNTIAEALKDADVKADQIGGLGIGCPGPLDLKASPASRTKLRLERRADCRIDRKRIWILGHCRQ